MKIKRILKYIGIDRMVMTIDPKTRKEVMRPLYEAATTHTARKTFIGNLYKQVKDPNLIASMSGHTEGSRAFARYRKIDDEMKKELVNLLD
jgi:integrase